MANAAVLRTNLIDNASISAGNAAEFLPVGRLQNAHVGRKWETDSGTSSTYLLADLGGQLELDTLALVGTNLGASGTRRVRLSTADSSGQAGDAHDSGDGPAGLDSDYGQLIYPFGAAATGRYLRLDLADGSLDRLRAGRWVAGLLDRYATNYGYGWSTTWVDRSRVSESEGGQEFIDVKSQYRRIRVEFETLRPGDRYGFVEALDRVNGIHRDVLFLLDPDSDNLSRDTVWGRIVDSTEIRQPFHRHFAKQYTIRERL